MNDLDGIDLMKIRNFVVYVCLQVFFLFNF